MLIFYSLLLMMLILALILLTIPLIKKKYPHKKIFTVAVIFMLFSSGLYVSTSNPTTLNEWLLHGKAHYDLMIQYQALGGLDGMIQKVHAKLEAHPNDIEGWRILGKLYSMKQDYLHAKKAFAKAAALKSALKN